MTFILYDRYFSLDSTSGALKTYWRIIGNKCNSVVQLHETYPVQTLNCFNANIPSLYIFCKLTQYIDFEKHQLVDIHKHFGANLKIFKFSKQLTLASSSSTLDKNLDNIQNIFMMHTRLCSNFDTTKNKESISHRILYKVNFNNENTRNDLINKLNFYNLTAFPDVELFVPFDDECEIFLNIIFPTNRNQDNSKYTYMTVIPDHNMNFVNILESFHGLIQLINSRTISQNVLIVDNREVVTNKRVLTDMFLDNVPIVDIFIGRIYENEQCIEFNSNENEIIFIMLKMYIFKRNQYVIFMNRSYQKGPIIECNDYKLKNTISCDNERDLISKFYNMYTRSMVFNVFNMDVHFIVSSERYKSTSYIIMQRIIYNNLWYEFSTHCVISEDGRCIRFNRNSIILFDSVSKTDCILTNFQYIDRDIYLPELYIDSTVPIYSDIVTHLQNIKTTKQSKYTVVNKCIADGNKHITTMSMYELINKIYSHEECKNNNDNDMILESVIELSNRIRIPITRLYSLGVGQIAYRLIFYTSIRNGIFLITNRKDKSPSFFQSENTEYIIDTISSIKSPVPIKIYQNPLSSIVADSSDDKQSMFQNLIKKFIPIHMTGNLIENYFSFFCPNRNQFPLLMSLVENESELLYTNNSIVWSRSRLFCNHSIVSFDFSLFYSSIIAIFGLDFQNCMIVYGYELKNFFYNIFPTPSIFENNKIQILQSPHIFIMDNDSLKIIDIRRHQDISSLSDKSCYIVIFRFVTTEIMQRHDRNYCPLSNLFYDNIIDMKKYKTRLSLHKNILNSICGMLSSYQINTTLLNVVYALSRKIMLWIVTNCLSDVNSVYTSFINHSYNLNEPPPDNLISIENDSFTFIYNYNRFNYDNISNNINNVECIKDKILDRLCHELSMCTYFAKADILQIFNLKINFITGNLMQMSPRKYYYIVQEESEIKSIPTLVSNEKNNTIVQKSLSFINRQDYNLVNCIIKNKPIKLSYLRRTHNMPEIRKLVIWYMIRHSRLVYSNENQKSTHQNLKLLDEFLNIDNDKRELKMQYLNILFNMLKVENIEDSFLNLLTNPLVNSNFLNNIVPDFHAFDSIHLPAERKTLIINCVLMFFRFYVNF